MWDLVGNPEDWFSHNEAHIIVKTNASGQQQIRLIFFVSVGGYTVFMLSVRQNESVSVTFCFLNILKSH